MAIKSAPYFWVQCDVCKAHSGGETQAAWVDAEQALIVADLDDWHIEDGRHLCEVCHIAEINAGADAEAAGNA